MKARTLVGNWRIVAGALAAACCAIGAALAQETTAPSTQSDTTPAASRPALAAGDPAATLVTLHLAGAARTTAFADLAAASGFGNPAGVAARNEPAVTLDADDEPYWKVFTSLLDQSHGLDVTSKAIGLPLNGAPGDMLAGRRAFDGAFVLALSQWDRVVDLTGAPAPTRHAALNANIAFEPRVRVLYVDRTVGPVVAVDENGLSLLPRRSDPQPPRAFNGDNANPIVQTADAACWPLTINVNLPPATGRRVARLSLVVRAWLGEELDAARIAYGKSSTQTIGPVGSSVTWSGSPDSPQVSVRFDRGQLQPPIWQNLAAFLSATQIDLVDDSGANWPASGNRNDGEYQDDQMTIRRTFTRPPPPAGQPAAGANSVPAAKSAPVAAILQIPAAVKPVELKFSFTDLPLP